MAEEKAEFALKGLIGQGAFGKVFLLENGKNEKFALKVIQLLGRSEKEIFQTIQEVKLLASLDHPYILKYVEASQDGTKFMIVTEFCPNGDLSDYMEGHSGTPLEESRLVEWIRQITSSLEYLHNLPSPIIHRDLKTANIFLDNKWDCKLGDFGIARVLETAKDLARTQCGTPLYMSPEVFQGVPYSDRTDIYSLGVMMYEMAHMDKEGIQPQMILFKIIHGSLPSMPTSYSDGVTDLMKMMLKNEPGERPSAKEILALKLFKTAKKPTPITDAKSSIDLDEVDSDDESDQMATLLGTLTQLETQQGRQVKGGGAARMMQAAGLNTAGEVRGTKKGQKHVSDAEDAFAGNAVMSLVHRTLVDMGKTQKIQGRTTLQNQADMLKMYILHCLDNNMAAFQDACKALDSSHSEDEIEELLIRVLGPEKYGVCGVQLLHYKNYTFNLRKK